MVTVNPLNIGDMSEASGTPDIIPAVQAGNEDIMSLLANVKGFAPLAAQGGAVVLWFEAGDLAARGLTPSFRAMATADVSSQINNTLSMRAVVEQGGKVVIWLDGAGDLDAKGMAPALRRKAVADIAFPIENASAFVPIAELDGNIGLWLERGLLGASGLAPSLLGRLGNQLAAKFAPNPSAGYVPLATDGRTLSRFHVKQSILRSGGSAQIHIGVTGDSWSDRGGIPQSILDVLGSEFTILQAPGFMPVRDGDLLNGVVRASSAGWTYVDGSGTSTFPFGAGPDGKCIYTTAADQTLSYTGVVAKVLEIYYRNHGGTFRYRVDGGAWTVVVCPNDGSFGYVSITGMEEVAHTLEIDTVGNAGTVSLVGASGLTDSPGIMVSKWGNGGTTGFRVNAYASYMTPALARLKVDLNIAIIGTNDYRGSSSPPSEYAAALSNIAGAVRGAIPDAGCIAFVPPRSNGTVITPLSAYRDAAYAWAITNGGEMLNLHDQLGDYANSNGYGIWEDDLHLNASGGRWTVDCLNYHFLHVKG